MKRRGQILRQLEPLGVDDLDAAGVIGKLLCDVADDRDLVTELNDDRTEVEHDLAVLRRNGSRVVVQDPLELSLGLRRGEYPELLNAWSREQLVGDTRAAALDRRGERERQRLLVLRQTRLDLGRDVDSREQLLGEP